MTLISPRAAVWVVVVATAAAACDRTTDSTPPAPVASVAAEPTPAAPPIPAAPPTPATALETAAASAAPAPVAPGAQRKLATASAKPTSAPAPSASAPVRKVSTALGTGASGEGFSVSIQAPTPVKSGATSSAVIVLKAVEPYHCNDKYPYKLVLDPAPAGVSYPQQTVRGMAIAEKQSSMSVPFSTTQPGSATIAGIFHFSICTADKCLIEKRRLSVTVQAD